MSKLTVYTLQTAHYFGLHADGASIGQRTASDD